MTKLPHNLLIELKNCLEMTDGGLPSKFHALIGQMDETKLSVNWGDVSTDNGTFNETRFLYLKELNLKGSLSYFIEQYFKNYANNNLVKGFKARYDEFVSSTWESENPLTETKGIYELYRETILWKYFKSIADIEQKKTVETLIEFALPILDKIHETLPTYCSHNGQHQHNVLKLMADLLGERIVELNSFETAILILSAIFHDIGLVYNEEKIGEILHEEYFSDFLNKNPKANILFLDNDKIIDQGVAELYCKWNHAKRVWLYLNEMSEKLNWGKRDFRRQLAEVCVSHEENPSYIKNDRIPKNFISGDLKFCAIILRIADILDFDNIHSPENLFKLLELDKPKWDRNKTSQEEWENHLATDGFNFKEWSSKNSYPITFTANPDHPSIEQDIKEFLDKIEVELAKCQKLLESCSDRWRNFKLPDRIIQEIQSQGYTFGDFKFSLDQDQTLSLLMGDNLYSDPFIFIREVLQNSIDTSRLREFHEKQNGKSDFQADPINFSTWYDEDGFRWIRIDDFGMGMTSDQLQNYFLKIGKSYYRSDEFKVSRINYQSESNFVPISKFGIGILSCFIVGDRIEVNTRSILSNRKSFNPID